MRGLKKVILRALDFASLLSLQLRPCPTIVGHGFQNHELFIALSKLW